MSWQICFCCQARPPPHQTPFMNFVSSGSPIAGRSAARAGWGERACAVRTRGHLETRWNSYDLKRLQVHFVFVLLLLPGVLLQQLLLLGLSLARELRKQRWLELLHIDFLVLVLCIGYARRKAGELSGSCCGCAGRGRACKRVCVQAVNKNGRAGGMARAVRGAGGRCVRTN